MPNRRGDSSSEDDASQASGKSSYVEVLTEDDEEGEFEPRRRIDIEPSDRHAAELSAFMAARAAAALSPAWVRAAAADAAAAPPPPDLELPKRGRPPRPAPPFNDPLFEGAPFKLGEAVSDLFKIAMKNNFTARAQKELFAHHIKHVNPLFPTFSHATSIVDKLLPHDGTDFFACVNDCYVHSVSADRLKRSNERPPACPRCDEPLVDEHGTARKVRTLQQACSKHAASIQQARSKHASNMQ